MPRTRTAGARSPPVAIRSLHRLSRRSQPTGLRTTTGREAILASGCLPTMPRALGSDCGNAFSIGPTIAVWKRRLRTARFFSVDNLPPPFLESARGRQIPVRGWTIARRRVLWSPMAASDGASTMRSQTGRSGAGTGASSGERRTTSRSGGISVASARALGGWLGRLSADAAERSPRRSHSPGPVSKDRA